MASTIVVADSASAERATFRDALKDTAYEVVGEAAHGDALLEACEKFNPWCVAFDLLLPGHADRGGDGGVLAMQRVLKKFPKIKFLAVHNVATAQLVMGALSAGAGARVRKPVKRDALLEALGKLGTGQAGTTSVKQGTVRLKKSLAFTWKLATDGFFTKKRECVTTEIGEAGLQIQVQEKIAKGAVLNVEVEFPAEAPLKARCQAAKVEPEPGLPRFVADLNFVEIAPAEKDRLKAFLRRLMERGTGIIRQQ